MTRRAGHYVKRTADEICRYIALGYTLKEALEKVGYLAPKIEKVWEWLDTHEAFREKYERARQLQADAHADRLLEMTKEVLDKPAAAAAYRVATDILKWQAAIRNRRVYGDKSTNEEKKPMDAAAIKAEIKKLENELGIAEAPRKDGRTKIGILEKRNTGTHDPKPTPTQED